MLPGFIHRLTAHCPPAAYGTVSSTTVLSFCCKQPQILRYLLFSGDHSLRLSAQLRSGVKHAIYQLLRHATEQDELVSRAQDRLIGGMSMIKLYTCCSGSASCIIEEVVSNIAR